MSFLVYSLTCAAPPFSNATVDRKRILWRDLRGFVPSSNDAPASDVTKPTTLMFDWFTLYTVVCGRLGAFDSPASTVQVPPSTHIGGAGALRALAAAIVPWAVPVGIPVVNAFDSLSLRPLSCVRRECPMVRLVRPCQMRETGAPGGKPCGDARSSPR